MEKYEKADVFLVCFALNDKQSLIHAQSQWVPEVKRIKKSGTNDYRGQYISYLRPVYATKKF